MRRFWIAAIASAITTAVPVRAAPTIIAADSFSGGAAVFRDGSIFLGPGRYRFLLAISGAAVLTSGSLVNTRSTNFYCDFRDGAGEVYCGGDDVPIEPFLQRVSSGLYQANLQVDPFTTSLTPDDLVVRTTDADDCCTYAFEIEPASDGAYVFSVTTVPEPADWSLMIVGFACAGATLRRRRHWAASAA